VGQAPLPYPGAHLLGAWVVWDLMRGRPKSNWITAARILGQTFFTDKEHFRSLSGFQQLLKTLSDRTDIRKSLQGAAPNPNQVHFQNSLRESVHNASANPIRIPQTHTVGKGAPSINELKIEAANALADEVTNWHFPDHPIETMVVSEFSRIEEIIFRPLSIGLNKRAARNPD